MLTFYMRVPSNKVVGLVVRKVLLSPLYCNKICKIILTCPAIHDTLYHKSHQICRKVQNGEGLFPMKIFTAPQHTRFVLPPFHPTKFFACLAGRYFSFGKLHLEFFISRLNEILRHDLTLSVGEPDNAAAQTGAGTAFGVNGDHEQGLCLFTRFALQNFQRALRFDF